MLFIELQFNSNKQTDNQTVSYALCFPNNEYSTQLQSQSASISATTIVSVRSLWDPVMSVPCKRAQWGIFSKIIYYRIQVRLKYRSFPTFQWLNTQK